MVVPTPYDANNLSPLQGFDLSSICMGAAPPPISFSPPDFLKHAKKAKNHAFGLLATCQTSVYNYAKLFENESPLCAELNLPDNPHTRSAELQKVYPPEAIFQLF